MSNENQEPIATTASKGHVQALEFPQAEQSTEELRSRWAMIHHVFAERVSEKLSVLFRQPTQFLLKQLETAPPQQATDRPLTRACCCVVQSYPLTEAVTLHFDAQSAFTAIECLLGGTGDGQVPDRPPSLVEERLLRTISVEIMEQWAAVWHALLPMSPRVTGFHASAGDERHGHKLTFELMVGPARGTTTLVVSEANFGPLSDRLCRDTTDVFQALSNKSAEVRMATRLNASQATLVVNLAETTVKTSDLLGLQAGDIITTDTSADELLNVHVEGVPKFKAAAGSYRGQKAIRVEQCLGQKAA